MRPAGLLILVIAVNFLTSCNPRPTTSDKQVSANNIAQGSSTVEFKIGQKWHYKTRPGEENSTLIILKLEHYYDSVEVVHICVEGVDLKNPIRPGIDTIPHLPFSKLSLRQSVTSLVSENNPIPDYLEGYNQWKKEFDAGTGGYFTIQVSEAIDAAQKATQQHFN